MARQPLWVIDCRDKDGKADFTEPQPESWFGDAAIKGITEDAMAKAVFRKNPDACLRGDAITSWPSYVDPRWRARVKTW